ncbi:sugar phosphate isomerase/epimerase [Candidatus Pacearchaeota archaeon]|nr:sugar phosphate isomerase/epimerase [Candidatus Pacearchaeota archaeon]
MVTILMPTMAAFRGDVETVLSILEKKVGNQNQIGLEIIGKADHFKNPEHLEKIVTNINELAKGAYISVHGFSGIDVYESGLADMRTEASGGKLIDTYMDIAKKTNAKYVHVHSAAGYQGLKNKPKNLVEEQQKIRRTLLSRMGDETISLGIENLPSPSAGDFKKYMESPKEMWCDCVETIDDCLNIVKDSDLKITLDTCHYACRIPKENIEIISVVKKLGEHAGYFHLSDVKGFYIPHKSVWKEGIIPGQGRIGEKNFKDFIKYIKENFLNAKLCIETDNADFKKMDESAKAIEKIVRWLE